MSILSRESEVTCNFVRTMLVVACLSVITILIASFTLPLFLSQHTSYLEELNTINTHKEHFEIREAVHQRSINSCFSDLVGKIILNGTEAVESGLEKLIPNIADILTSLLGGVDGNETWPVDSFLKKNSRRLQSFLESDWRAVLWQASI
jgi:hypothetical protein